MQIKYIMALLCGLLISLGASSQEAEPTVGSDRDDLSKIVKVEKNEALSNLKKVVITSFSVEVLTYLKAGGSGDLGNLISGKPNSVSVNLKGHDIGTWPDMVNQYYGQLVKQLESSGIEVIRPESLQDDADYKTILEAGKPSSHEEDAKAGKGLYFGVDKVPMLIQNEQNVFRGSPFSKPPEDLYMTFGSQFAAGFSTASAQNAEYALARKLDAHALKVRFTVVPTSLTTTKGFWVGTAVDSKASLSLPTHVNRFVVYSPSGDQGKISLSAPAVGKQTVGEMKEITSTAGTALRAADTAGGIALGFLTGGIGGALKAGANVAKDYEVSVDNAAFNQMLVEELSAVSLAFVSQLKGQYQ
ncbi:MAG: hypothetical protein V5B32_07730 [Candidatus Accumulibacter sp. UW26]|jgi:hypothetical protein